MHKIYALILSICFASTLVGQEVNLNMELLSNMPYPNNLNDIWGYVAPDGSEYAIVGTTAKTSIVDLSDPRNPVEVAEFPGANSTWRDMKQFGEFVYVTTDVGSDGLLVIDMTGAPNDITGEFWQPNIEINGTTTTLERCHNIFIDEDGYAYLAGCNMNSGGNLIIDLFSTPGQPQFVSATDPRYSHDAMVQNNLLYSSDINNGFFSVIDVTDKLEPITLSTANTSMNFTHNAWVSTDNNFLFTTDELANSNVDSYDISDLTDIRRLDSFQPKSTIGEGTIPHNTHYLNGFLVTSWYTNGVRIIDANRPDNLVEVGFYDTFQGNGTGFQGCWGVTPYLPSGLVIASDINTGLYVFETEYVRAAYLEGIVSNSETGLPVDNVTVTFQADQLSEVTNPIGEYKSGQAMAGEYTITFERVGYNPASAMATLINGEVTILDVNLVPLPSYTLSGTVKSEFNNAPIADARVYVRNDDFEFEVNTNEDGVFNIEAVFGGEYEIFAGAWGFENVLFNPVASISQDEDFNILLGTGIMDDFIVDLGWTTGGMAETGAWVRDVPIGTTTGNQFSNPSVDIPGDIGDKVYVTGNVEGGVGLADIDGGTVTLTSPMMDLTTYINPEISYNLWFFNGGGAVGDTPNDNAVVRISNGETEVDVEVLSAADSEGDWRPTFTFNVAELIEITSTMRFSVSASDDDPGHLVEAGLDQFLVSGDGFVSTSNLVENDILNVVPNPFNNNTLLSFEEELTGTLTVTNVLGQLVDRIDVENASQIEIGSQYSAGAYFISLEVDNKQYKAIRIIKQ